MSDARQNIFHVIVQEFVRENCGTPFSFPCGDSDPISQ